MDPFLKCYRHNFFDAVKWFCWLRASFDTFAAMGAVPYATRFAKKLNSLKSFFVAGIGNETLCFRQRRRAEEIVIDFQSIEVGITGAAHDAGAGIVDQLELFRRL